MDGERKERNVKIDCTALHARPLTINPMRAPPILAAVVYRIDKNELETFASRSEIPRVSITQKFSVIT